MSRWAPWIVDAVRPTPDELRRVAEPVSRPALDGMAVATRATEDEIHRLLVNRHAFAARRRQERLAWGGVVGVGAMVAAAGLFVLSGALSADPYGPVSVGIGQVAHVTAVPLELGPSIDVTGEASVRVDQADVQGTVLALVDGRATFSVDPQGEYRSLKVHANDVEVEVAGTVFDVALENGTVWVEVTRGKVIVRHQGEELYVRAGERWTDEVLAAVIAPPLHRAAGHAAPVVPVTEAAPSAPVVAPTVAPRLAETRASRPPVAPTTPAPRVVSPADRLAAARAALDDIERRNARGEDPHATLAAVDAYLVTWGDTTYAASAKMLRLHLLAEAEPGTRAIQEIDAYLAGNPRERQRQELLWLRADMARSEMGNCALALGSYRELAAQIDERDPKAARASAYQGLCALALDLDDEANEALQRSILLGVQPPELYQQVNRELKELQRGARKR